MNFSLLGVYILLHVYQTKVAATPNHFFGRLEIPDYSANGSGVKDMAIRSEWHVQLRY